ncbi:ATPase [Mycobacterium sp. 663a-19]|uniref:ATPase n=1 Tax=Mycobacterium sp. 663a-19 TaxID=2986148 RepID=UPI002D1E6D79|nr:ATPase [Mycobacterium sp. 663a-19]MEB3984380.1 ATPase [Mycobacterium sp. 663a-19]
MNFKPSHTGPGAPPADSTATERIPGLAQPRPPRIARPAPRSADPGDRPARMQRTRRTVDLPAATHRALDIWQREAADRIGVARVTGQEVLSALIDQLLADPKLAAQITRAIQHRR